MMVYTPTVLLYGGVSVLLYCMNILGLGLPELLVIAFVLLLFFGKDRLPQLFRSVGTSIRELKDGLSDSSSESANKTVVGSDGKVSTYEQGQGPTERM